MLGFWYLVQRQGDYLIKNSFFNKMEISFTNGNSIELGFVVEHRVDPGMNLY